MYARRLLPAPAELLQLPLHLPAACVYALILHGAFVFLSSLGKADGEVSALCPAVVGLVPCRAGGVSATCMPPIYSGTSILSRSYKSDL